jgi:hypothetical protein
MVTLWTLGVGEHFLDIMNMTLVNFGEERDWRAIYYILVFVVMHTILLNLFSGFIIMIFLQFYTKIRKAHGVENTLTKEDIEFKLVKFEVDEKGNVLTNFHPDKHKSD